MSMRSAEERPRLLVTLTVGELEQLIADAVARAFDEREKTVGPAPGGKARLTIQEAAEELRCSPMTVRRHINSGRLRTLRINHGGSSRVWIPRAAIERLLADSSK